MHFDSNRSLLVVTPDRLRELVGIVTTPAAERAAPAQDWVEAGIIAEGHVHPMVAKMVEVALNGHRSILLERFDGLQVAASTIAFDRDMRATITDMTDGDEVAVTATHVELLPGTIRQMLRLHSALPAPDGREPIATTAGAIDQAIGLLADGSDQAIGDLVGSMDFAWRVSGSWRDRTVDTSLTVLVTRDQGAWLVEHDAEAVGSTPDEHTTVTLRPTDSAALMALLGDVVTGRTALAAAS